MNTVPVTHQTNVDRFVYYGLLLLLFWVPLPFGSNRPWAGALLFLLAAVLLSLWLLLYFLRYIDPPARAWQQLRWPLLLLGCLQLWIFLQTLPLPREWVAAISPRAAALHQQAGQVSLSLDQAASRFQLLLGLAYTGVFVLVVLLVHNKGRINGLLWTLVFSGSFQAIYGSLMTLTGVEFGFFVEKYAGLGVATGTFINRNHLAGYLVLALAAGIGLLISLLDRNRPHTTRSRLRSVIKLLLSSKFLLRLLLATMVVGLVLTRSRMGNFSFFASLTLVGTLLWLGSARRLSRGILILFVSLLLVDMIIIGQWFGAAEVAERLLQTSMDSESRDEVSALTLGIIRDFPLTGSGAGSFYSVFPHYGDVVLQGDYYTHAHNDYLELAGDVGLPVAALFMMLLLGSMLKVYRLQFHSKSRTDTGISFVVLMAGTWALLHSAVDFNLQIPANACTLTALLGLAWLVRQDQQQPHERLPHLHSLP